MGSNGPNGETKNLIASSIAAQIRQTLKPRRSDEHAAGVQCSQGRDQIARLVHCRIAASHTRVTPGYFLRAHDLEFLVQSSRRNFFASRARKKKLAAVFLLEKDGTSSSAIASSIIRVVA